MGEHALIEGFQEPCLVSRASKQGCFFPSILLLLLLTVHFDRKVEVLHSSSAFFHDACPHLFLFLKLLGSFLLML